MHKSAPLSLANKFVRAVDGIAALEFALLAPIMIYTICMGFDLGTATLVGRRLTNAADVVGELVSQQTDSNGNPVSTITNALLMGDFFSVVSTFPNVLADAASKGDEPWQYDIQVIASQVEFGPENNPATCIIPPNLTTSATATPPQCSIASVIWSAGFTAHQQQYSRLGWTGTSGSTRQCGAGPGILTETTQTTSSPGLTAMPKYLYEPGDIIVVDILYTYTPMFTRWFTGSFTYERAAYITPRFFAKLAYSPPGGIPPSIPATVIPYTNDTTTGISSCLYTGTSASLQ
jgi:TadE-like protein